MVTLVALLLLLLYLLLYLLIVLVSLLGDHLLRLLPVQSTLLHLVIALSDTAIHGLISSCSWAMALVVLAANCDDQQSPKITSTNLFPFFQHLNALPVLKDLIACFLLAALIDVDHIFAAGSLNIAAMASLERRPVMHNTPLVVLISAAAFLSFHLFSCQFSSFNKEHHHLHLHLLWLHFLVASLTHHIRDGLRHGLLFPLGYLSL
ncbi:hypothetical protein TYRP_022820 [Tyrophagus putrescentiae]|nr:hypothetical protein TYRP_022820 [Tyrophagus putrescentiae]